MLILNINGPMNAGKSTVSKILTAKMPNSAFIEVDDLMSDSEQEQLGLSLKEGWKERHRRLDQKLRELKASQRYDTVIFAYPIADASYRDWSELSDQNTRFLNITLAPTLTECLKNRGHRELTEWEKSRIKQMYREGYQDRSYADFIINNDSQTPEQTADVIMAFVRHALSDKQQWFHLIEERWPALMNGEKTSTFRLNEGFIRKGFLVYRSYPKEQKQAVVFVTKVYYVPLKQAMLIDGFDEHTPDLETGLRQMKKHYPDITLNTPIILAQHLSVAETQQKYAREIQTIFSNRQLER